MLADPDCEIRWGPLELHDAVSVLLSFGARIPDDSAAVVQAIRVRYPDINAAAQAEKWASLPALNAEDLGVS